MAKPHTCPLCKGTRFVPTEAKSISGRPIFDQCPTCEGTGVVWETGPADVGAGAAVENKLVEATTRKGSE